MRLNGQFSNSGRLEVYYENEWGTVCDDAFDMNDAIVACRQLGFAGVTSFFSVGNYADAIVPHYIWLDNVECFGTETRLDECGHNGWGSENCGHSEDIILVCSTSASSTGVSRATSITSNTASNTPSRKAISTGQ